MTSNGKDVISKSISFVDPTENSYYCTPKSLSEKEAKEHMDALEEFQSKKTSHVCTLVIGGVFIVAACVLLWAGVRSKLRDLSILGAIVLIFGVLLITVSLVLLCLGYARARRANRSIRNKDVNIKTLRTPKKTLDTQNDLYALGFSPVEIEVTSNF